MKLYELIYADEYFSEGTPENEEIAFISTDEADIKENTLYVFIDSIKSVREKILSCIEQTPPSAIVCKKGVKLFQKCRNVLYVDDPREALAYAYSRFYKINYGSTKFIGVTGTNGKTTTATLITQILREAGNKTGFIGSGIIETDEGKLSEPKYSMTTPDPQLLYKVIAEMQAQQCSYIVMEVSSHALFYKKLAPIPFYVSVFTNLSPEHLDFHKTLEAYFKTKLELFSQTHIGVFNVDDTFGQTAYSEARCEKFGVGILWEADANATDIEALAFEGHEFIYREKSFSFKLKSSLLGSYNIYNLLLAIKAALALGIKPCIAKKAVAKIEKIEGRFEIVARSPLIIIDYAHTALAFESILKSLKSLINMRQKLIVVFGCGGERDRAKRPLMGECAERYADVTLITSDNPRGEPPNNIIAEIASGFKCDRAYEMIPTREAAIKRAIALARKDDVIALIGKGHERYMIDAFGYHPFDEREIVKAALEEKAKRGNDENCAWNTNTYT